MSTRHSEEMRRRWKDPAYRARARRAITAARRERSLRALPLPMGVTPEQHAADLELLAKVKREWGLA